MKKIVTMNFQGLVVQIEANQGEEDRQIAQKCCDLGEAVLSEIRERQRVEELSERMAGKAGGLKAVPPLT